MCLDRPPSSWFSFRAFLVRVMVFNATFIFFQLYMDDTRVAEKTTFRRSMTIVTTGHLGMHVVQINMQYYILCSIQIFPFANSLFSVFFSFISYLLTICCYIFEHSEGRTACRSGAHEFIPCVSGVLVTQSLVLV